MSLTGGKATTWLGYLGRRVQGPLTPLTGILGQIGGISALLASGLFQAALSPFTGPRRLMRKNLYPLMSNVGARSLPIVSMVSFLMGAILVLQTGEPLRQFGQIQEVPGAVALALAREISPLMTAILMTARVGASFTAVLGSMKINEELLALETMGIRVESYLVAPRFTSMLVMVPCLTVFSYLLGMAGGAMVANAAYDIPFELYVAKTLAYLTMTDLCSGLVKSGLFSLLITSICCYFGLHTEGGSVGLGRNIMTAVVTSMVAIIVMDALATGWINNYIL
ncbi:MAG: ABC transporter permease [bacterium]|nr:ABC transporter permease [bacterium]